MPLQLEQVYVPERQYPFGPQKELTAIADDGVRLRPLSEQGRASTVIPLGSSLPGYRLVFSPAPASARADERILSEIAVIEEALSGQLDSYFAHLAVAHLLRDRAFLPAIAFGQIVREETVTTNAYWVEVDGFIVDFRLGQPVQPADSSPRRIRLARHFYGDGYHTLNWRMLTNRFALDLNNEAVAKLQATFSSTD